MRYLAIASFFMIASTASVAAQPVRYSGNGHFYELVTVQLTWVGARAAAEASSYNGMPGYLATITSTGENDFLNATFNTREAAKFAWIAGYEPEDDGVWLWGSGPEDGVQFSMYASPTPPFNYANWGGIEPNDNVPGEDFLSFNIGLTFHSIEPGEWGDAPDPNPEDPIIAYIV